MSTTFVTEAGSTYLVEHVTQEEADAAGCPDATHRLTGRTGTTYALWLPGLRPTRSVPLRGWRGRAGHKGRFWAHWNAARATGLPGWLIRGGA